ncbi:hypothetical protein [Anaerobacillus alkaliphilus]|uniref:hypothetical protein n=1 Tax=Anaerobacillus alkaliphilus TaxID=1548597 RepID=UPI00100BE6ED|nr:hypothetical protein [Anaerobacillus alkaliphilus]
MIVQDLIETTEFFTEETKDDFFVIYEKFANSDCNCEGNMFEEIECDDEEIVQILQGNPDCSCSLRSIESYRVGQEYKTVEDILAKIKKEHTEIFK